MQVVAGQRLGRLHDAQRQIVVVEQRLAAGVLRQRVQRVLRSLEVRRSRSFASWPLNMPMPPGDGRVASPSGACATRPRASIVWIDDVGANRGVDRRAQLRLVVGAVQPQPAREVDQRLLLGAAAGASSPPSAAPTAGDRC